MTSRPSGPKLALEIKALSDPTRLELVELIAGSRGHQSVAFLAERASISPALASYHLGIAAKAGILHSSKRGSFTVALAGKWWLSALESRRNLINNLLEQMGVGTD